MLLLDSLKMVISSSYSVNNSSESNCLHIYGSISIKSGRFFVLALQSPNNRKCEYLSLNEFNSVSIS